MTSPVGESSDHPGLRPIIGLTADGDESRYFSRRPYADAIATAGGLPLILPHRPELAESFLDLCDAVVLTGGDDARTEPFGVPTHPKSTPVAPSRQAFELAMLDALRRRRSTPVLGICLGMQFMALHAGGALDQHLPDTLATHAEHWGAGGVRTVHEVVVDLGDGVRQGRVTSHHRQAVRDAGRLTVVGRAHDGVIECLRDLGRPFYVGVQWHPERTDDAELGLGLLRRLVEAAARARAQGPTD